MTHTHTSVPSSLNNSRMTFLSTSVPSSLHASHATPDPADLLEENIKERFKQWQAECLVLGSFLAPHHKAYLAARRSGRIPRRASTSAGFSEHLHALFLFSARYNASQFYISDLRAPDSTAYQKFLNFIQRYRQDPHFPENVAQPQSLHYQKIFLLHILRGLLRGYIIFYSTLPNPRSLSFQWPTGTLFEAYTPPAPAITSGALIAHIRYVRRLLNDTSLLSPHTPARPLLYNREEHSEAHHAPPSPVLLRGRAFSLSTFLKIHPIQGLPAQYPKERHASISS